MHFIFKENINNKNFFNNLLFILFATFPIAIILGNMLINIYIVLISLLFLIFQFNFTLFKNKTFLILIFFFISLLINLIFSDNFDLSYPRVFKFFFIIFFILSFEYLVNLKKSYDYKIFKIWSVILTIFMIDLFFEFIFGHNTLGMKAYMPSRLSGFFGDELVAGYFLFGFALIYFSFMKEYLNNNIFLLLIVFTLIIVLSLIIGERSNFIKLFLSILILIFTFNRKNLLINLIPIFLIVLIFVGLVSSNKYYNYRFISQVQKIIKHDGGIDKYLKNSEYGAHYDAAYKIFQRNKLFGVGIKNFRVESSKFMYHNKDYLFTFNRSKTHPHQIHYELLSETGLVGYISFLIFIILSLLFSLRYCILNKNFYQLATILFILTSLIPYLPSGSFFSTFNSSLFWVNYAIMVAYNKKLN